MIPCHVNEIRWSIVLRAVCGHIEQDRLYWEFGIFSEFNYYFEHNQQDYVYSQTVKFPRIHKAIDMIYWFFFQVFLGSSNFRTELEMLSVHKPYVCRNSLKVSQNT
jgi:hypothetical protein